MELHTLKSELRAVLDKSTVPLVCAYLYGSAARGAGCKANDIDVAVLTTNPMPPRLLGPLSALRGQIETRLGGDVDLVDLRRAPPDLVHRILRDGQLLVERDPEQRIAFEVAARNAYFDVLPHLEQYRRSVAS